MPMMLLWLRAGYGGYSAHASCLMDAGSRALIAEHDGGDNLGFAHDLRKRICFSA
jgi:hypothetical protein